jgi:hypothetical protein
MSAHVLSGCAYPERIVRGAVQPSARESGASQSWRACVCTEATRSIIERQRPLA